MAEQKAKGIKILGSFLLVCSILGIPMGIIMATSSRGKSPLNIFVEVFMRLFFLFFPLSYLISSFGLLRLKNRGRLLTIINASVVSVVTLCLLLFCWDENKGSISSIVIALFIIVPSCSIIYFLTRPKVKEQFK